MPQRVILVPGTWAMKQAAERERDRLGPAWWQKGGSFVRFLEREAWSVVGAGDPRWSTKLDGTILGRLVWRRWYQDRWLDDWREGGRRLCDELTHDYEPQKLVIIGHSHAINVIAFALAEERCPQIWGLCTVGSPNRDDMQRVFFQARRKILGPWHHFQMGRKDIWSWLGTIGSGSWQDTVGGMVGLDRGPAFADSHVPLMDYDHNDILTEQSLYYLWPTRLDYLRYRPAAQSGVSPS